jgi:large subunit ribosomal protein L17
LAKAKVLKRFVEPLITKSKTDTTHSRRTVFRYLKQKEIISELFGVISEKIINRPGGYTRIIKTGNRLGDNAEMCMMELVDFNEVYSNKTTKAKKSRTRRSKKLKQPNELKTQKTEEVSSDKTKKIIDVNNQKTESKKMKKFQMIIQITKIPNLLATI